MRLWLLMLHCWLLQDAWLARHTCLTFRSAAAHLTPSSRIQAAVGSATSGPSAAATAAVGTSNNSTGTSNDQLPADMLHDVLADLVRLLVAAPPASMAFNWPSAAEAAVGALYALSPQPQELMVAVLKAMFVRCKPGEVANRINPVLWAMNIFRQFAHPGPLSPCLTLPVYLPSAGFLPRFSVAIW